MTLVDCISLQACPALCTDVRLMMDVAAERLDQHVSLCDMDFVLRRRICIKCLGYSVLIGWPRVLFPV